MKSTEVHCGTSQGECSRYFKIKSVYVWKHLKVSWIKINLMSLAFLFHYLMLSKFRMLIHTSSGACDLLWIYFMRCIALVQCVLVLRFGWAGVVWYPDTGFSLLPDTTPSQPDQNVTPTHIEPEQYNPWNNSTNQSQAPEDGCINIRNMLSIK